MTADPHERAKRLIGVKQVERIVAADREWLDGHLETCAACSEFAGLNRKRHSVGACYVCPG